MAQVVLDDGPEARRGDAAVGSASQPEGRDEGGDPVGGTVTAVNTDLNDIPEDINSDPYDTWIYKLKPSAPADYKKLLDATGYKKLIEE